MTNPLTLGPPRYYQPISAKGPRGYTFHGPMGYEELAQEQIMRTTKTRTVPAVPAVSEREVEYEVVHCDACGVNATERYTICEVCKRELCWECPRYLGWKSSPLSGYPTLCPQCHALWKATYDKKLAGIKTAAETAEAEALREWAEESLAVQPVVGRQETD